jgi:hypothetical protein
MLTSFPPPMALLVPEAYRAMTHIYMLARKHGKNNFDDPICSDNFHKLLWGVYNFTCCNEMTREEQFAIAVSMSMNKPLKTSRILSTCELFKDYKFSDVDVQLSEDISAKTSWESILSCAKFSFTYVPKDDNGLEVEIAHSAHLPFKKVKWASNLVVTTDTE